MAQVATRARLAGLLLALAFASACGSESESQRTDVGTNPASPRIVAFTADPASIPPGGTATLAWTTADAISISIEDDAGHPVPVDGLAAAAGSVVVAPDATTTYTLTAVGGEGSRGPARRTATVAVDVVEPPAPVIETFEASAGEVPAGGEVTLSWRITGATALTLHDDAGQAVETGSAPVEAGSVVVHPGRVETTYLLTAIGPGGTDAAQVSVGVLGLPRVHRFTVQPVEPVDPGSDVLLVWETSRADRVVIRDDAGATVVDTTTLPSGSHQVTLDHSTLFELTAIGPGGESGATVLARVGPSIDRFEATPRTLRAGDAVALTWATRNAESVTLTGPGGFREVRTGNEAAAGALTTAVPASGDYRLAATLGAVVRDWAIYVEVTEAPRIRSLAASVAVVTAAADHPDTVRLDFAQDGAESCSLYRNNVIVPEFDRFSCGTTGSLEVELRGAADLRLVAYNSAGAHQASVHVDAIGPARIVAFGKTPDRRVATGETVQLAWEVTDAVAVRMEKNGSPFAIGATDFSGTRTDAVDFDSVYTLVAENSLGHLTSADVAAFAGPPVIQTFAASPPVVLPGDDVTFAWTVDGGETLSLLDPTGLELANHTEHAAIDAGSATVVAPATPGVHAHTLRVTNAAAQTATADFDLVVTDGPLIRSLTASASRISLAGTVTLTWTVADGPSGAAPALALADNFGNEYDVAGQDPNAGAVTITPPEEGRHVFTLTATTPGTRPSSAEVVVEVTVAPKILSFVADPPIAYTEHGSVVPTVHLTWTTENGVALSLFEADADGQPVPPALHQLSGAAAQAAIDAGSFDVHPAETTRYLLRLTSRIGTTVTAPVTVRVDPPRIVSFEADVVDLIEGESTDLRWVTDGATVSMLQPVDPTVTETANTFVDISTQPNAEALLLSGNDSYQTVAFPSDFRFPFDGKFQAGMRVVSNGYLSFDLTGTGASISNQSSFPTSATYAYVHLAPFWDSLAAYANGTVYWAYDDVARTVTVMWKNWSYRVTTATFDLNFEVVLHENGSFEYRYGRMFGGLTSSGTDYQYYADAAWASIGFQNLTATGGKLLHYGNSSTTGRFPGGLGNRGWFFDLATPVSGSRSVTPDHDRTYTLTAANADAQVTATADVRVHAVPVIGAASIYPSGPQAGVPFEVSWQTTNASRIRVYDLLGQLLCEQLDPAQVVQGSCSVTVPSAGNQSITVEAIGGIERNVATRVVNFVVFPRLAVELFAASDTFIASGGPITLTWQGAGGFQAELYACVPKTNHASCAPIDISAQDPNHGSYTTTLSASKEFWFRLVDRLYRSEEATATVWVDAPKVDSFTASATQVAAGQGVTLNWATTGGTGAPTFKNFPPVSEVTAAAPYVDITSTGTNVPIAGTATAGTFAVTFPSGFQFPFFGVNQTRLVASADGWVTFDPTYTSTLATNYSMPTSATYQKVSLAPFWDNLQAKASGRFYYELRAPAGGVRSMVFQWSGFEFGSSTYNPADLNFQMVLFENGDVEYRYGTMTSSTGYPLYAAGSSATIGYQNYDVTAARMLAPKYNTAVEGGLQNRSWRFNLAPLAASGSVTVVPADSTTYEVCVTNASLYDACRSIRVVVVKPGDLLISELMIAPADAGGEWVEVRNLAPDPIDLAGFTLGSGTESFAIPATPAAPVPPNGFRVLARSGDAAANGGVSPAVVYGGAIELADAADDVRLEFGNVLIDRVTWSAGWPIQANRSIAFEPSVFNRDESANNAPANWCATSSAYGGGFTGSPGAVGSGCLSTGGYQYYLLDPYAGAPFIDISQTGTPVTGLFSTPYYTGPIPLGFSFPYFADVATEMWITRLGYVTLEPITATPSTSNSAIDTPAPATLPNGIVAPMWDAHSDRGTAAIAYEVRSIGGQLAMVVQWTDVTPAGSSDYGLVDFQTQLWQNGDIVFAYRNLRPSTTYPDYQYVYGSSSTIGLESIGATSSIQIFYGTTSSAGSPIYDGRSYRFTRK